MPKRVKKVLKSKAEIVAELKKNSDFAFKMKFVREEFWPALIAASTSVEDATQLLAGFNTTIMQEFLALMKDKKVSELNLETKLDPTSPKFPEAKALLALFTDMSIFDAKDQIEGMRNEIDLFLREERQTRTLSDLQVKWIDTI